MLDVIPNWHPIFVHFTVALLLTSSALFTVSVVFSEFKYKKQVIVVARCNLWMGSLITILTLLAGWHAYNTVSHDPPSHVAMTDHRNWAIFTATLFFILAVWQLKCRFQKSISLSFLISILVASTFLITTAYKGGEIVYRYGLGVMSIPEASEHGHSNRETHKQNDNEGNHEE